MQNVLKILECACVVIGALSVTYLFGTQAVFTLLPADRPFDEVMFVVLPGWLGLTLSAVLRGFTNLIKSMIRQYRI